ncbi:hypothetical protein [Amycolatopsis sp. FDAARGOS 1241]|uniref:hypothetical protein n=1 Tax=Amycolatopsis sp. FDAARGOS 1241 TaxID=2778070 RepID=UPI00194E7BB0|nr:hypothetical protein [Amycolatopsis sp. FDAARGOS 1241]QRP47531.1 hypothetical protein I6J71_06115 [Amycolatopsis sp. FDAARGOS 1241]
MVETITARYAHENDDWTITVSGRGKEVSAKAPGIIAARDRADQLVDEVAPDERPTVVHLLNGSALEFTSTYMAARLTLPDIEPLEVPPSGGAAAPKKSSGAAEAESAAKPPMPPSKQLPKEVEDRKAGPGKKTDRASAAASAAAKPSVARRS